MRLLIIIQIMLLTLASCASKKEKKEISDEMDRSPAIGSETQLYSIQRDILSTNKNLTNDQKSKLTDLIQRSRIENLQIQSDIAKTKALLFKELVSNKDNRYKIKILEGQLLRLSRKKTRYSIAVYKEARDIVGKSDVPVENTLMMIDNRTLRDL